MSAAVAARAALETVIRTERAHARRWVARITTHPKIRGELGATYAWRQAKRHLRKAAAARAAAALLEAKKATVPA